MALHIHSEQTDGGQLLAFWIRNMSLGGVWESGATYGFVQGAGVTLFIPLAVVGHSRLIKLGWGALHWTETSRAEPCRFGPHPVLRHLSKNPVLRHLSSFMSTTKDQFASLALPLLPSDRNDIDIHSLLGPLEIALILRRLNLQQAMRDMGHFRLFGTLEIGHSVYFGLRGPMATTEWTSCSFGHLVSRLRPLS